MSLSCFSKDYDPTDRSTEVSGAEDLAHTMSEEKNPDDKDSCHDDHEYE